MVILAVRCSLGDQFLLAVSNFCAHSSLFAPYFSSTFASSHIIPSKIRYLHSLILNLIL